MKSWGIPTVSSQVLDANGCVLDRHVVMREVGRRRVIHELSLITKEPRLIDRGFPHQL